MIGAMVASMGGAISSLLGDFSEEVEPNAPDTRGTLEIYGIPSHECVVCGNSIVHRDPAEGGWVEDFEFAGGWVCPRCPVEVEAENI